MTIFENDFIKVSTTGKSASITIAKIENKMGWIVRGRRRQRLGKSNREQSDLRRDKRRRNQLLPDGLFDDAVER